MKNIKIFKKQTLVQVIFSFYLEESTFSPYVSFHFLLCETYSEAAQNIIRHFCLPLNYSNHFLVAVATYGCAKAYNLCEKSSNNLLLLKKRKSVKKKKKLCM